MSKVTILGITMTLNGKNGSSTAIAWLPDGSAGVGEENGDDESPLKDAAADDVMQTLAGMDFLEVLLVFLIFNDKKKWRSC